MKLAGLYVDQFGAQSQLSLPDISDHLNVVFGPNGVGKTTIIQFIRWMLYGQETRLTGVGSAAWQGSVQVRDTHGVRTYNRPGQWFEPNLRAGDFNASADTLSIRTQHAQRSLHLDTVDLRSVGSKEFDDFFHVTFDRMRDVNDLLRAARSCGFRFEQDEYQSARIRQLTDELQRKRIELSRLGDATHTAESLRQQREEKQRGIESLRYDAQRRRDELQAELHQAAEGVAQRTAVAERCRDVVNSLDASIHARREQLNVEFQQLQAARHEAVERRNRRMEEIDIQLQRWQQVLTEVRQQLEMLSSRMSGFGETSTTYETVDTRFFASTLGSRIQDLENDLSGVYESDSWRDSDQDNDQLRGLCGSALHSMRSDVTRLCEVIDRQQRVSEVQECRNEVTYLSRVEQEIADLVQALRSQRDELGREQPSSLWPGVRQVEHGATRLYESGLTRDVGGSLRGEESVPPYAELRDNLRDNLPGNIEDVRLLHLTERRESAALRLQQADVELRQWQRRLHEIETQLERYRQDGQIAVLEREIHDIDARLPQYERRLSLQRTIDSTEAELHSVRQQMGQAELPQEASRILQRLTNQEYHELRISGLTCYVTHRDSRTYEYARLSQGVKDQVYLSLCLAIVSSYRSRGLQVPFIVNDVFINLDQTGTNLLAKVLADFAHEGQQILVFTRHEHIRRTFEPLASKLFSLGSREVATYQPAPVTLPPELPPVEVRPQTPPRTYPVAEIEPGPADPTYRWVAEWQRSPTEVPFAPSQPLPVTPEPRPIPPVDTPADDEEPPIPASSLSLSSLLTQVPTLSAEMVGHLETIDVEDVAGLLELDPSFVEAQLGVDGITADIIQRRQRELLMLVHMGVSALEAQLLVACGVPDPERLGRADVDVLIKRIETILERPQAAARFGTIEQYTSVRVRRWIEIAQRSGYRAKSIRGRSQLRSPRTGVRRSGRSTSERGGAAESRVSRTKQTVPMQASSGLRFYLEVKDPVVDAPSIGPKTAERLHAVDIYTVGDLLAADPQQVAINLDDRRIDEEILRQWQLQAQLVCRIPNLRGHDAQILVACGIEEPSSLVGTDASTFLKRVTRFVETKEGQRVLRNGKRPDLAEVTAWIEWSENARQLRAA